MKNHYLSHQDHQLTTVSSLTQLHNLVSITRSVLDFNVLLTSSLCNNLGGGNFFIKKQSCMLTSFKTYSFLYYH
uniref:Uncharacterized protein n=1 Tax=Lepeophtheirus salmonis TaxID=72036 RepID=A0A0K2V289_LEPSM